MKNAVLVACSIIIAFAASVGLDRLAGLFQAARAQSAVALVFPPNIEHNFRTQEFSYTVQTNSLGFRDREFSLDKTAKVRVLTLGDSFTFGYGVEANQAWPKVLEAKLRAAGYDLEIANLGRPGGSPRDYAAIAEKAIPVLRPDLVLVAVLQGDDLAQMVDPPPPNRLVQWATPPGSFTAYPHLRQLIAALYPHLLAMADKIQEPQLFYRWKQDAQSLLQNVTPSAKARFEKLDREVQEAFMSGQLNPALMSISLNRPDYFLSTVDVNSPNTRHLIVEMADQLRRINLAARENHAKAVAVSVPYGVYVSQNSYKTRQRLGFELVPETLSGDVADQPIRLASETADVSFFDVTDGFRKASRVHDLFFELDGHFNAAGHERFATLLMPTIQKIISEQAAK